MHLCAAELIKLVKSPFIRGLLLLFIILPLGLMMLIALNTDDDGGMRWPHSLVSAGEATVVLTFLLPPLLVAWLVGQEQSNDTWKVLLARSPGRAPFIVAKIVVATAVFLVHLVVAVGLWTLAFQVVGAAFDMKELEVSGDDRALLFRGVVAEVLSGVLSGFAAAMTALLGALVVPKNATIAGVMTPVFLASILGMIDATGPRPFFYGRCAHIVAGHLCDTPLREHDAVVSVGSAAAVLAAWVVVPVVAALILFTRRDVESGAG